MNQPPVEQDRGAVYGEVFQMTLALLARREDRWELAAVAGWLAVYGGSVYRTSRAMERSPNWVYRCKRALQALVLPYTAEDDYLAGVR